MNKYHLTFQVFQIFLKFRLYNVFCFHFNIIEIDYISCSNNNHIIFLFKNFICKNSSYKSEYEKQKKYSGD